MVNIIERLGVTCVMVTHDQEEAMTMAHRIAVMDAGWIRQVGTPDEIYEQPSCRFTAEFIGSVNLIEGQIKDDEKDFVTIASPAMEHLVYVGHGVSTSVEDKRVTYALRPEKLWVTTEQPSDENNWSVGKVQDIAYLGGHSVFYIELPSGMVVQAVMTNAERRGTRPTWGDQVFVHWENDSGVVLRS